MSQEKELQAVDAWVQMPSESDMRAQGASGGPYDFGFLPNMGRLIASHSTIGPAFSGLFATIMFQPGVLSRQDKELVAAVAASAQDCFY